MCDYYGSEVFAQAVMHGASHPLPASALANIYARHHCQRNAWAEAPACRG